MKGRKSYIIYTQQIEGRWQMFKNMIKEKNVKEKKLSITKNYQMMKNIEILKKKNANQI